MTFFPRKIQGRYAALSRCDGESNHVTWSEDGYHWNEVQRIDAPPAPWEVVHTGNCGAPIETDSGWLVLTHGAGPVRGYSLGAMLLDREEPTKVLGKLREPLLEPAEEERDGYVPNVVYSCGSLLHSDTLLIPYGFGDWKIRFATIDIDELLSYLT